MLTLFYFNSFLVYFLLYFLLLLLFSISFLHPTKTLCRKCLCLIVPCVLLYRWVHFSRAVALAQVVRVVRQILKARNVWAPMWTSAHTYIHTHTHTHKTTHTHLHTHTHTQVGRRMTGYTVKEMCLESRSEKIYWVCLPEAPSQGIPLAKGNTSNNVYTIWYIRHIWYRYQMVV